MLAAPPAPTAWQPLVSPFPLNSLKMPTDTSSAKSGSRPTSCWKWDHRAPAGTITPGNATIYARLEVGEYWRFRPQRRAVARRPAGRRSAGRRRVPALANRLRRRWPGARLQSQPGPRVALGKPPIAVLGPGYAGISAGPRRSAGSAGRCRSPRRAGPNPRRTGRSPRRAGRGRPKKKRANCASNCAADSLRSKRRRVSSGAAP